MNCCRGGRGFYFMHGAPAKLLLYWGFPGLGCEALYWLHPISKDSCKGLEWSGHHVRLGVFYLKRLSHGFLCASGRIGPFKPPCHRSVDDSSQGTRPSQTPACQWRVCTSCPVLCEHKISIRLQQQLGQSGQVVVEVVELKTPANFLQAQAIPWLHKFERIAF